MLLVHALRSDNAGRTWEFAGNGIELTVIHNLAQVPDDPGMVHLGMCDNGYFRSVDGGASYRQNWEVITNNIKDIAVSPKDYARLYAIGPTESGHWYSSHVFVSDDRGSTWRSAGMKGMRGPDSRRINTVVADPYDRDMVWACVSGTPNDQGGVMRSRDAGQTWQAVNKGLPAEMSLFRGEIWNVGSELAVSANGAMVAVSHGFSRVFYFDPQRGSWQEAAWPHGQPNAVEADPFVPGRFVAASLSAGLIESRDGGETWKPMKLNKPTRHLAFDQAVAGRMVAGTLDGVYFSTDNGSSWSSLDLALPNRIGNPVAFAGDRVVVGSSGCGAFWIPLTDQAAQTVAAQTVDKTAAAESAELFDNGAFDAAGAGPPAGRRLRWSDHPRAALSHDTSEGKQSPGALRFEIPGQGYGSIEYELPHDLDRIRVEGFAKVSGAPEEAYVAIQVYDTNRDQIAWSTIHTARADDTDWELFAKTIELPSERGHAYLTVFLKGECQIWLDDLSITNQ